jgi:membrane associated rhomboid family serine protease/Flp pilus assembly protein TadD
VEPEISLADEAVIITQDMLVKIPARGSEIKNQKETFEQNMTPFPLFILAVIIINITVYVVEVSTGALLGGEALLQAGALKRELVLKGEYWRLFSAGFLHADNTHLGSNLIFLYILGMAAEHAFGFKRIMLVYFSAILSGSLLSIAMRSAICVGASGAVFGLMGALIVFFLKNRQRFNIRDGNIGLFIGVIAAIQLFFGFTDPHIDNYAHIGGFLGGGLLALLLNSRLSAESTEISSLQKKAILGLLSVTFLAWLVIQGHICMILADLALANKNFDAAISCTSQAIALNPQNSHAYLVRGKAYLALKQDQIGEQDIEQYIAANSNKVVGYITLGDFFVAQNNYAAAISNYSEAIRIQPGVRVYNSRGYARVLLGDYEKARSDFQQVLRLDGEYAPGYGNLGLLDAINENYDAAITMLDRSFELDPSLEAVKELSAALRAEQASDYISAIKHYQVFSQKTKGKEEWLAEYKFASERLNKLRQQGSTKVKTKI